jgi:hypothetical protein
MKAQTIITLIIGIVVTTGSAQGQDREAARKELENNKQATVDYERVESGTAEELELRKRINRRYDNEGWVMRSPHYEDVGVGRVDEAPRPPVIPVKESSLVIVGKVVSADAYLSNDKQGIYTEFSICVSEVLKADPLDQDLKKGGCVTADRPGGVVRMPTGQKMWYSDANRGLPEVGQEYAMFLTRDNVSPNYSILTLYEFRAKGAKVDPNPALRDLKIVDREDILAQIRREIIRLSEVPPGF